MVHKYSVGDVIEGVVTKIVSYGAYMVFPDGSTGLLHISQISDKYIRNIYHFLYIGAPYCVKILDIDSKISFLKLSLKDSQIKDYNQQRELDEKVIEDIIDFTTLETSLPGWINKKKEEYKV